MLNSCNCDGTVSVLFGETQPKRGAAAALAVVVCHARSPGGDGTSGVETGGGGTPWLSPSLLVETRDTALAALVALVD